MTNYLPLFINLARRPVLVVGGGLVATAKIEQLIAVEARITVVAPAASDAVRALATAGRLVWEQRSFAESDLEGQLLVIAATNDDLVNALVFNLAEGRNMLANSVDDLENCNFIMAAVAQAGPIQVAVSTGGASPTLARQIRTKIHQDLLDTGMDQLAAFLGRWRASATPLLPTFAAKRDFWNSVMASPIPNWVCSGQEERANTYFQEQLEQLALASATPVAG